MSRSRGRRPWAPTLQHPSLATSLARDAFQLAATTRRTIPTFSFCRGPATIIVFPARSSQPLTWADEELSGSKAKLEVDPHGPSEPRGLWHAVLQQRQQASSLVVVKDCQRKVCKRVTCSAPMTIPQGGRKSVTAVRCFGLLQVGTRTASRTRNMSTTHTSYFILLVQNLKERELICSRCVMQASSVPSASLGPSFPSEVQQSSQLVSTISMVRLSHKALLRCQRHKKRTRGRRAIWLPCHGVSKLLHVLRGWANIHLHIPHTHTPQSFTNPKHKSRLMPSAMSLPMPMSCPVVAFLYA